MSNLKFVKLIDAGNEFGQQYTDKRATYIGKSGLIDTVDAGEGFQRIVFLSLDANGNVARLTTSNGVVVENDSTILIRTGHSKYLFSKDYNLTSEEELILTEALTNK